MKKYSFAIVAVSLLMACQNNTDYLRIPTQPPVYESDLLSKNYKINLAQTTLMNNQVDILWVIDNSGSMGVYQQNVIKNTGLFMNQFTKNKKLKWKMGLLSTDRVNPPYIGFTPNDILDWTATDPVGKFQTAVSKLGTVGTGVEESFDPILIATKANPNFLRPKAVLAMIIVTDTDDQGLMPTQAFVDQLVALKGGDKDKILTYGIFASTDDKCGSEYWYYDSSRNKQLMDLTRSKRYYLCSPNFGELLANLGKDLISKISYHTMQVALSEVPVGSSLRVYYKGTELAPGFKANGGMWVYNPIYNVIEFTDFTFYDGTDLDVVVKFQVREP